MLKNDLCVGEVNAFIILEQMNVDAGIRKIERRKKKNCSCSL